MSNATPARNWWLPQEVPQEHTLQCRIGPLSLDVHHARGEWQVAVTRGEETFAGSMATLTLRGGGIDGETYDRFIVTRPGDALTLQPLLTDRPVVITPRHSVFLPSGEEVTLYMSTPATLRLEAGEPPVLLREVASLELSDTWFGPSTREGELCYSGRTHARHSLAEVPLRAHRVTTPVRIRNEVETPLPLDKFSLPVPLLSVYGAADGRLWTQEVSLVRTSASDMASLKIADAPPRGLADAVLVSGPREAHARGGLVRAFSMLFGDGV